MRIGKRDLQKDLLISDAAKGTTVHITECQCVSDFCDQVFISISHTDGRLDPVDAKFIQESWNGGWRESILRAQQTEERERFLLESIDELRASLVGDKRKQADEIIKRHDSLSVKHRQDFDSIL